MDSTTSFTAPSFTKWRRRLWPVHSYELKKLIPLLFIKFCVSFVYTILHATKDTITVTTIGSGAEAIPILKGWVVIVMAFAAMLLYSKLSNHLSRPGLFYATMIPFLIFFAVYGFFLYPNRDWLSPHQSADWLVSVIGKEHEHWISVYRYWMNSLFFVMAELWGGIVIGLLFWGFANQISTIYEAKRFYTLFSAGGHIGVIVAGPLIWYYSSLFGKDNFHLTVEYLMGIVTLAGVCILITYYLTNRMIEKDTLAESQAAAKKSTEKTKLSLRDSIPYIVRSPYLGYIALMVIGYSLSVNMVEVAWKGTLKLQHPQSSDYQAFMGMLSSATGVVSLCLALFVGGNVLRKFGWYASAQMTPLILGISSLAFFSFYFLHAYYPDLQLFAGISSMTLIVMSGAFHNVACKSMKYCLFDPTKEMAYIPLDEESKIKGKAAVDVVASRFGKSGSSWIQAALIEFVGFGSVLSVVPYLMPCVMMAVSGWMYAVFVLNGRLLSLQKKPEFASPTKPLLAT